MSARGFVVVAACIGAIASAACGGASGPANAGAADPRPTSDIARIHKSRCGQCHVRVEPGERTRAELETALARHRSRTRLTEDQWDALVDYLAAPEAAPAK